MMNGLMVDPSKIKRYAVLGIKILIALEIIAAITEAASGAGWGRLGTDLVIAGIVYLMWGRLKNAVEEKRRKVKDVIAAEGENLGLWDAMAFSLLWSDEIYASIPADRKRLVVISFTLIAIGLLGSIIVISNGFMQLIVSTALVLAAVNLLVWVVSTERGEKESLQTEMKLAREVQSSLMPEADPVVEGLDVAGRSVSALEVGGDHFAYHVTGKTLWLSVFDVSGKGMHAAMSAVFVSGGLASELESSSSPSSILTKLNRSFFAHSQRGQFTSFVLGTLDVGKKRFVFSNAGQVKPLLLSSGTATWLNGTGVNFPLGMTADARYRNRTVRLKRGDVLFLMTDGVTEAMSPSRDLFGEERVEEIVKTIDTTSLSSSGIIGAVADRIRSHMEGFPRHDDMTLVVVKIL